MKKGDKAIFWVWVIGGAILLYLLFFRKSRFEREGGVQVGDVPKPDKEGYMVPGVEAVEGRGDMAWNLLAFYKTAGERSSALGTLKAVEAWVKVRPETVAPGEIEMSSIGDLKRMDPDEIEMSLPGVFEGTYPKFYLLRRDVSKFGSLVYAAEGKLAGEDLDDLLEAIDRSF